MATEAAYIRKGKLEILGELIEFLKENGRKFDEEEPSADDGAEIYYGWYVRGKLDVLNPLTVYVRKKIEEASNEIVEELWAIGSSESEDDYES